MKKLLILAASLALSFLPCMGQIISGEGGTVDNAAINAAIAEDVAATQAVLNVTSNVITPTGLVSDAKRHSNGVVSGFSVTCASANFLSGSPSPEIGKTIRIEGAGNPATATLTHSGGVINGSTITYAGSSGGYVPNDTFLITVAGGGGTGAIVRAVTNSSGQVSSIVIDAGGTGYSSPTATFPSNAHITTIASRSSSTAITLTAAAPTAIGSNAVFYYGTNNTTAIQDAIDDAYDSLTTKKVVIPNGSYLGNWKMRMGVELHGAASRHTQDYEPSDTAFNLNVTALTGVQLVGATMAPVIDSDISYGASYSVSQTVLSNLAIYGSTTRRGFGVRYGIANGSVSGYVGAQFVIDRVMITGFEYGLSINRVSNFSVQNCEITGCAYGPNFGGSALIAAGTGGTDGVNFNTSGVHGCTVSARFNNCKNATLSDCDFGGGTSGGAYEQNHSVVTEASNLTILSANTERIEHEFIKKTNGRLTIHNYNCLTPGADSCLVGEYGTSTETVILNATGFGGGWGASNSIGGLWRAADPSVVTGWPTVAPHLSGALMKYSSTVWTTQMEVVRSNDYFAPVGSHGEFPLVSDRFTQISSSPYGEMGWVISGISGSFVASAGSVGLRWASSANTSTNIGRLALNSTPFALAGSYISKFYIKDEAATSTRDAKTRVGLYTNTASFTPVDGFGFRYDPTPVADESLVNGRTYVITSAGDTVWTDYGAAANTVGTVFVKSGGTPAGTGTAGLANVWLETINNSTVTSAETTVLGTTLSSNTWLIIQKTPQGTYGCIKNSNNIPQWWGNVTGTLRSVDVSPAVYVGGINTVWLAMQNYGFTFRNL